MSHLFEGQEASAPTTFTGGTFHKQKLILAGDKSGQLTATINIKKSEHGLECSDPSGRPVDDAEHVLTLKSSEQMASSALQPHRGIYTRVVIKEISLNIPRRSVLHRVYEYCYVSVHSLMLGALISESQAANPGSIECMSHESTKTIVKRIFEISLKT